MLLKVWTRGLFHQNIDMRFERGFLIDDWVYTLWTLILDTSNERFDTPKRQM
jgi:hypothetical protein